MRIVKNHAVFRFKLFQRHYSGKEEKTLLSISFPNIFLFGRGAHGQNN